MSINIAEPTIADYCTDRMTVFVGQYTDVIRLFYNRNIYVSTPAFDGVVQVTAPMYEMAVAASVQFQKYFDITPPACRPSQYPGFEMNVADLTVHDYIDKLEKVYLVTVL